MKSCAEENLNKIYLGKIYRVTNKKPKEAVQVNFLKRFEYPQYQFLDFPATIMRYLLQIVPSTVYNKLNKTCKYFYSTEKILLIEGAQMVNDNDIPWWSKGIIPGPNIPNVSLYPFLKVWVTNSIEILLYSSNSYRLSNFCKKIYKSTIVQLDVCDQKLTEKEFDLLVGAGFLLSMRLYTTFITKCNGDLLTCEEIFERIPKAMIIRFVNVPITSNSFFEIAKMQRFNKIKHFEFTSYDEEGKAYSMFGMEHFKFFIKKCMAPRAFIQIGFVCLPVDESRFERERNEMDQFMEHWKPFWWSFNRFDAAQLKASIAMNVAYEKKTLAKKVTNQKKEAATNRSKNCQIL